MNKKCGCNMCTGEGIIPWTQDANGKLISGYDTENKVLIQTLGGTAEGDVGNQINFCPYCGKELLTLEDVAEQESEDDVEINEEDFEEMVVRASKQMKFNIKKNLPQEEKEAAAVEIMKNVMDRFVSVDDLDYYIVSAVTEGAEVE